MTSLRAEVTRDLIVLASILGAAMIFPYSAVDFQAAEPTAPAWPRIAFVRLTDAEEESALRAAKSAWQMEANALRGNQAWLPLGELPQEPAGPILPPASLPKPNVLLPLAPYRPPAWEPTQAADAPRRIPSDAEKPQPAFSREELLTLP